MITAGMGPIKPDTGVMIARPATAPETPPKTEWETCLRFEQLITSSEAKLEKEDEEKRN